MCVKLTIKPKKITQVGIVMLSLLLILNAITKLLKVFYYLNIEYATVYRVYVLVS